MKIKKCCKDIEDIYFRYQYTPVLNYPKKVKKELVADFDNYGCMVFKYCPFCGTKIKVMKNETNIRRN